MNIYIAIFIYQNTPDTVRVENTDVDITVAQLSVKLFHVNGAGTNTTKGR